MLCDGDSGAQIGPQKQTRHENWIKFPYQDAFIDIQKCTFAKRISNLDLAQKNDGNRLFGCIFRDPDALKRTLSAFTVARAARAAPVVPERGAAGEGVIYHIFDI